MALQADEKIIAHRRFTMPPALPRGVRQVNQDGSVDEAFSVNYSAQSGLASPGFSVQADGGLLIAGSVSPAPGGAQQDTARQLVRRG